jgi:puromycin-sensitive aminopeptidase
VTTKDVSLKRRLLTSLGAATNRTLLTRTLSFALNTTVVRVGDAPSLIASVAGNPNGRDLAWAFVKTNWPELNKRYGSGGFSLSTLVSSTAQNFNSQPYLDDINEFYTANPVEGAYVEWQQAMESIGAHIQWTAADLAATCTWLQARY